jgi:hypothetical protein
VRTKIAIAIVLVSASSFAANDDGVPLSPDAMIAGITISPHDASTGAWYNPAALGGISRSSVQLSTSIYTLAIREIDGLVETRLPWETRHDPLSATNFTTVPSGVSFVFRITPRIGLSAGIFSPQREYASYDTQITSTSPAPAVTFNESVALTQRLDANHGQVGMGFAITDKFRVGLAALLTQQAVESVIDYSFSAAATNGQVFAGEIVRQSASYFGLRGGLGIQWDAAPWLRLSLAARSPVLGFAASGQEVATIYGGVGPASNPNSTGGYAQTVQQAKPSTMAAPARLVWSAEFKTGIVRFAFEGDIRHPIDNSSCGAGTLPRCTSGADKWVANARAGLIVQATPHFWVGAGAFTDMGGWDLQKSGQSIDYFGGTVGVQFRAPAVVKLRGNADPWDLKTTLAARYGVGIGQVAASVLDLSALTITPNPTPGTLTYHEVSVNVATALEF